MADRHSLHFPDESDLLGRAIHKDYGRYQNATPAGANFAVISTVGVGGQGENFGGNGAFARRKAKVTPGEILESQVGQPGTGGSLGDSWCRRYATGEMLCYADRGRGTGGVQGSAARSIGDVTRSGMANVGSGSDGTDQASMGFIGREASKDARRAPGPGGAGEGIVYPGTQTRFPAGQGFVVIEWYRGDPGLF